MKSETYKKGSLSLAGTIAMGTGVMIGAGIFALTGQVAQFSGPAFPLAFLLAAVVRPSTGSGARAEDVQTCCRKAVGKKAKKIGL